MKEPEECEVTAVDRFIDDRSQDNYARWCLLLMRFPSSYLADFEHQLNNSKLFCTWKDNRYAVEHASPHGYIKLRHVLDPGVAITVSPFECADWGAEARPTVVLEYAFYVVEIVADMFENRGRHHAILRSVGHTETGRFFTHAARMLRNFVTAVHGGKTPWKEQ